MQDSTYDPKRSADLNKNMVNLNGQSIYFECDPSDTAHGGLTVTDDHILTGGILLVKGGDISDKVSLQVLAGETVVRTFISEFRISDDQTIQFHLEVGYPAKIFAGLTVRCVYVSGGLIGKRKIALNMILHKILA